MLVFDIGMSDGADSAYYLHLGHSVVGVEANPEQAAACGERFGCEIDSGQLAVLNIGILDKPGSFPFYRNLTDHHWSSFRAESGQREGRYETINVPCVTLPKLIDQYGKPYFIKIDIEGADFAAVNSLYRQRQSAPKYISVEGNCDEPFIECLQEIGYSEFKFIDCGSYHPLRPILRSDLAWRAARKISRSIPIAGKLIPRVLPQSILRSEWFPNGRYSPDGYTFTELHSGPFGEDASGTWTPAREANKWFNRLRAEYAGAFCNLWFDIHARLT